MTKNELITAIAAVLTTALETEPDLFPESMAYLALGGDISTWEIVREALLHTGYVTIEGNIIRLTTTGRNVATRCNALLPA